MAAEKYALVITGASGGEAYAQKYDTWRASLVSTLANRLGYDSDHLLVLAERKGGPAQKATRENVERGVGRLRKRLTGDDQLVVVLIGHGTSSDGEDAKFNLVGPDLSAAEWSELVKPLPGSLLFVDTTAASFPFLKKLAGRGRIVLTATDSAVERYETVFPEFFVKAFDDPTADADKNGKVSLWEAFTYASAGVRRWFDERGQLPTERSLLDDTGAGVGREAQNPGPDGELARVTYLDRDVSPARSNDPAVAALLKRRAELESALDRLKTRKATMSSDEYEAELEKLLLEITKIASQIRGKS